MSQQISYKMSQKTLTVADFEFEKIKDEYGIWVLVPSATPEEIADMVRTIAGKWGYNINYI